MVYKPTELGVHQLARIHSNLAGGPDIFQSPGSHLLRISKVWCWEFSGANKINGETGIVGKFMGFNGIL